MKKRLSSFIPIAAFLCLISIPGAVHAQAEHWHERVRADAAASERPWMGIAILDITPDVVWSLNTAVTEGLLVSDVNNGGPAHSAGVDIGDVILRLDGVEITDAGDFVSRIRGLNAGATVNLQVSRNGVVEDLEVTLGRMPYLPPPSALPYIPTSSPITHIKSTGVADSGLVTAQAGQAESSQDIYGQSPDEAGAAMCRRAGPFHDQQAYAGQMTSGWNYGKIYMMAMDTLGLTPEQRAKADGLWPEYLKKTIKSGAEIKVAEIELMEVTSSEPVNLEKARQKVIDISSKRSDLRFFKIKTIEEFKKILTSEQRDKLKGMMPKGGALLAGSRSAPVGCGAPDNAGSDQIDPTDLSDASTGPAVE